MQDALGWEALEQKWWQRFRKPLTLHAALFVIGLQEIAPIENVFTHGDKEDIIHLASCFLLTQEGYYEAVEERDVRGWRLFAARKNFEQLPTDEQERLLKKLVVAYFSKE